MPRWTKLLKPQEIVNGRLVMCMCDTNTYYRYLIFPTEVKTFADESKIIKSGYNYTSWRAAMSAGKKAATELSQSK